MNRTFGVLGYAAAMVGTTLLPSLATAQYCAPGGAMVCGDASVCEPVSPTLGVCCADDPNAGSPPYCIGAEGPQPATVLSSELLGLLTLASDPALAGDLFTGPWTNWYTEPRERGLAKLALMRGILESIALHDTYVGGTGTAIPIVTGDPSRPVPTCTPGPYRARSIDGSCTDTGNPLMGARGTRFGHNVPIAATYPDEANLLEPNPRTISLALMRRRGIGGSEIRTVPFLNNLAGAWTQFQVHDWFDHGGPPRAAHGHGGGHGHGRGGHGHGHGHGHGRGHGAGHPGRGHGHGSPFGSGGPPTIEVPLGRFDPLRLRHRMDTLSIIRTMPDPTRVAGRDDALPPTYVNDVTHWWDASQVYGSDEETAARLRTFSGGRMLLEDDGLLPTGDRRMPQVGMDQNFWVGLELLHTVFVHEHNAIAEMLEANHPDWNDQRLYDTARLINAALIAKIHTLEWTPAILPNSSLHTAMYTNWYGLNQFTCPQLPQIPGLYPNPVVYGLVGNVAGRALHGAAYAMTEEFVSVYRMHPLLPERFRVRSSHSGHLRNIVPTGDTRDGDGHRLIERHGMRDMLYSFGTSRPGALTLDNYPQFLQDIEIPGRGILDMATTDIVRDRERGVPRYNTARQLMGLPRVPDFLTLTGGDAELAGRLDAVYGGDIDRVDLLVGSLAEGQRPSCYGFGETLFQVFVVMATRRLQADPFYTQLYTADVYTAEGLAWVEDNSMRSVLLRHFPELAETGLSGVHNAFYPWE